MWFCLSLLVHVIFVESDHNQPYYEKQGCYKTNFDFYGHDLHVTVALSYYECQEICRKDWDCKFFTFSIQLQKCWLKDKIIFMNQTDDRISGPKSCLGYRGTITVCQENQQYNDAIVCRSTNGGFFYVKKRPNQLCCLNIEGGNTDNCKSDVKNLKCDDFTLCQKRRFKDKMKCDSSTNCLHYVTKCKADGGFQTTQSDGSKSWCVNILNGLKIEGSEHRGQANNKKCDDLNQCWKAVNAWREKMKNCDSKTSAQEKYTCLTDLDTREPKCNTDGKIKSKICVVRKDIQFCWCVNSEGNVIDGTFTEIKKNNEDFSCVNPHVCMNRFNTKINSLVISNAKDEYVPQCRKSDRSYLPRQCQNGLCWCVDAFGTVIENTQHSLAKYYDCVSCKDKRKIQNDECTNEDCFIFKCMSNAHLYSPKQCHKSICWCVDYWGNIIKGSYQHKNTDLDCQNYNICPTKKETDMVCEMNGAYKSKQTRDQITFYFSSDGAPIVIARSACQEKAFRDEAICGGNTECFFVECDENGKFKNKMNGNQCLDSNLTPSHEHPCPEFTKCEHARLEQKHGKCFGKSPRECYIPQCEEDGQFKPKQCKGSVCWCVDVNGEQTKGVRQNKFHHHDNNHQIHFQREFTCREFTDCEKKYAANIAACEKNTKQEEWRKCEIMQCSTDGEYISKQCMGGECWCIDSTGKRIDSLSSFLLSEIPQPTCTVDHGADCNEHKKVVNYLNCDEFGYFKPLQCDNDNKCWCVDPLGKELEIPNTLLGPQHEIECMQLPKDKNNRPRSCNGRCIYFYDNHFDDHIYDNPSHNSNHAPFDRNYDTYLHYRLYSSECACDPGCMDRNDCCRDYLRTCLY